MVGRDPNMTSLPSEEGAYFTQSVHKVVSQKSIPAQIRLLILYISDNKGQVGGSVNVNLTFEVGRFGLSVGVAGGLVSS